MIICRCANPKKVKMCGDALGFLRIMVSLDMMGDYWRDCEHCCDMLLMFNNYGNCQGEQGKCQKHPVLMLMKFGYEASPRTPCTFAGFPG